MLFFKKMYFIFKYVKCKGNIFFFKYNLFSNNFVVFSFILLLFFLFLIVLVNFFNLFFVSFIIWLLEVGIFISYYM